MVGGIVQYAELLNWLLLLHSDWTRDTIQAMVTQLHILDIYDSQESLYYMSVFYESISG